MLGLARILAFIALLVIAAADTEQKSLRRVFRQGNRMSVSDGGDCHLDGGDELNYGCKMFFKTQTKVMDCWYACIQMLRSAACAAKTKPEQDANSETMKHRGGTASATSWWGTKLNWESSAGKTIIQENGLKEATQCSFGINDFYKILNDHGPFGIHGEIAGQGHFVVVYGVDKAQNQITIADPAWKMFKKKTTQTLEQLKSWMHVQENHCVQHIVLQNKPSDAVDKHPAYCAANVDA